MQYLVIYFNSMDARLYTVSFTKSQALLLSSAQLLSLLQWYDVDYPNYHQSRNLEEIRNLLGGYLPCIEAKNLTDGDLVTNAQTIILYQ